MRFYGLHFVGSDKIPVQVRVNTKKTEIWARSAPNGEWTPWRRLDVTRNADGTLAEEVAEATHAKRADTALRLTYPMKLSLTGDVSGEVSFDGSENVTCVVSIPGLGDIRNRLDKLEKPTTDPYDRENY
ncbi:hypothetical protein HMPREF1022_02933 [Desulfovibrio sp. 6_1_46AFAA]|uniref:hypothetical protein n=1 Tax=Desulfovibrio sp. 6_1_46AFAA TaxID=665942 RepID=UPI0002236DFD|nr:hypothetical protein [Desulfovibrio sp. 6_1_46AFAA]EGW50111.1 hypothetical protein HMPREF1022_02933 [Desulfovibrio sp. 6_1_46AFAA]